MKFKYTPDPKYKSNYRVMEGYKVTPGINEVGDDIKRDPAFQKLVDAGEIELVAEKKTPRSKPSTSNEAKG